MSLLDQCEDRWRRAGFSTDHERKLTVVVRGDLPECRSFVRDTSCEAYVLERSWAHNLAGRKRCQLRDVVRVCVYIRKSLDLCRTMHSAFPDRWLIQTKSTTQLLDRNRDDLLDEISRTMR